MYIIHEYSCLHIVPYKIIPIACFLHNSSECAYTHVGASFHAYARIGVINRKVHTHGDLIANGNWGCVNNDCAMYKQKHIRLILTVVYIYGM